MEAAQGVLLSHACLQPALQVASFYCSSFPASHEQTNTAEVKQRPVVGRTGEKDEHGVF